jgi:hypothetical protein
MMNRPYLHLESSGPLLFDGLKAVCWFVHMDSNITSPRITNISPGELYTFVFTQSATGGYVMNWPVNCINAAPIDPAPNSTTIQSFIGDTGAMLYANLPPTGSVGTP